MNGTFAHLKKAAASPLVQCILFSIALLLASFYGGYEYRGHQFVSYLDQFRPLRTQLTGLDLISPLVGVDSPNAFDIGLFSDTKDKINDLISDAEKNDGLLSVAIYYRDLNSSVWFGINEDQEFVPASLLKMTYALAAYKEAEDEPGFLLKTMTYTQDMADETRKRANADDATALVVGRDYSVRDLVSIMLIQSDNGARDALQRVIKPDYVNKVFTYLGISAPEAANNFEISDADYALFFRMLYSAAFISDESSEDLLSILTKTNFQYGIRQALPSKIPVAHKWGVYNFPQVGNAPALQELHDCGIVYAPSRPILICIMTKGTDQEKLASFIANVSKVIYDDTASYSDSN